MTGSSWRSLFLIAMVGAIAVLPTASASASTAFECAPVGSGAGFSDAHCRTASIGAGYKHQAIGGTQAIEATDWNTSGETTAGTSSVLKTVLSGVSVEISCLATSASGSFENTETGGEMVAAGTATVAYSFCKVSQPAGKGCSTPELVEFGVAGTTLGLGKAVKLTPAAGAEQFVGLQISGCSIKALNNTYPVKGSVIATATGATLSTNEIGVTEAGTLTVGGQKAGLTGSLTVSTPVGSALALT
ncbi:MAG TPA: hypothetical protein VFJ57_14580 [Solirubrobacterales bacterium]|nr:hypothetical protein [Solirubrobacterales bacterium]